MNPFFSLFCFYFPLKLVCPILILSKCGRDKFHFFFAHAKKSFTEYFWNKLQSSKQSCESYKKIYAATKKRKEKSAKFHLNQQQPALKKMCVQYKSQA